MSSKEEYLKRYLSVDNKASKKKKVRKEAVANKVSRVKILDDDIDLKALIPSNISNSLDEDICDDKPVIAQFIDERPDDVKLLERFRKDNKWKLLGQENHDTPGVSSDTVSQSNKRSGVNESNWSRTDSLQSSNGLRNTMNQSTSGATVCRRRYDSDSDESSAKHRNQTVSLSQSSNQRHDSDISPPRQLNTSSPRRRQRHDSDQSPSRQRNAADSGKSSMQRKQCDNSVSSQGKRRHSDSDQSPPRQRKQGDSDGSPPRQRTRHDSDQSPPRQRTRHDSDQSPPRQRTRHDSDQSPPRQRKRHGSDQSPPRQKQCEISKRVKNSTAKNTDCDMSAPRTHKHHESSRSESQKSSLDAQGRATKTLAGAKAGLQSRHDMVNEARILKAKEDAAFNMLPDELLGKNAAAISRKKTDPKEDAKKAEAAARKAEAEAKYQQWNKGLKQRELHEETLVDMVHEANKPLARYEDDTDLDDKLREQERDGDPMLAFIKKSKGKQGTRVKPRYSGPQPPTNRFNIWPGFRWDGVDRSNGFERQFFSKISERKVIQDMAYKWSVEDM